MLSFVCATGFNQYWLVKFYMISVFQTENKVSNSSCFTPFKCHRVKSASETTSCDSGTEKSGMHKKLKRRMCMCMNTNVWVDLCDELQVVDVVLLGDDELVDVSLPLPLHGAQHVQQVEVSAPWNTNITHTDTHSCHSNILTHGRSGKKEHIIP